MKLGKNFTDLWGECVLWIVRSVTNGLVYSIELIEDDPRSGRPSVSTDGAHVHKIKDVVHPNLNKK